MATHSSTLAWKIPWMEEPVGCRSWDHEESDMTEQLHFHFSLLCTGEVNGNPLQCSCLENPRDGGAWGAAIYGVAQSRTRLKWLSSSSSSLIPEGASEAGWNFGNKGCDLMSPTPGRAHDEHVHARVYLSPRGTGPVREGASSAQHKRNGVSARRTVRPGGAPQKGRISRRSIWRATV